VLPDGRFRSFEVPIKNHRTLYPEEWARVAIGVNPSGGNAMCSLCSADYYLADDVVTLVGSDETENRFVQRHLGRKLTLEQVRWLGIGKSSGAKGLVCAQCSTEFDLDGSELRLVDTDNPILQTQTSRAFSLGDWHRIARELPLPQAEDDFSEKFLEALRNGYRSGQIGFDSDEKLAWKGVARKLSEDQQANLVVNQDEITFGGLLRKQRIPADQIMDCHVNGNHISWVVRSEQELLEFDVQPIELVVQLSSGNQTLRLTAEDLFQRWRYLHPVSVSLA
jgi:hypothetical protein